MFFCYNLISYLQKSIAKITRNAPTIKLEADTVSVKLGRTRFSANDLPADIKARWSEEFSPLWRKFLGTLTDPWDTDSPSIHSEMQACFDTVYPGNAYGKISHNDVVFSVVRISILTKNIFHNKSILGHATFL